MSKHTPGPWTDDATLNHYTTRVIRHNGIVVARLPTAPQDPDNEAEMDANAALIASAPEMLEALRMLADDHEHGATGTIRQEHLRTARAAIARAEGRQG